MELVHRKKAKLVIPTSSSKINCFLSPGSFPRHTHLTAWPVLSMPLAPNTEFLSFLHSQLSAAAASLSAPAPRVQHSEVYKALCSTDCDPQSPVRWPPAGGSAAFQARSGQELSPQTRLEAQRGRSRDPAAWRPGLHPEALEHRPAEPHAGCHFIFGPRAQFAPMRSAVLKPIQPESLPDCKATLGGSCNLSASVLESPTFREARPGNARCLALRHGCASLRQRDASKFWREKRCIWIPAVVGKGQSGEQGRPVE